MLVLNFKFFFSFFVYHSIGAYSPTSVHSHHNFDFPVRTGQHVLGPDATLLALDGRSDSNLVVGRNRASAVLPKSLNNNDCQANKQYGLKNEVKTNGMEPSLNTRWGPLKLSLYSNRLVNSGGINPAILSTATAIVRAKSSDIFAQRPNFVIFSTQQKQFKSQ
jgi:hypothetical protein